MGAVLINYMPSVLAQDLKGKLKLATIRNNPLCQSSGAGKRAITVSRDTHVTYAEIFILFLQTLARVVVGAEQV